MSTLRTFAVQYCTQFFCLNPKLIQNYLNLLLKGLIQVFNNCIKTVNAEIVICDAVSEMLTKFE